MKTLINIDSSFLFILVSVILTAYMQLVLKWQSRLLQELPATLSGQIDTILHFLLNFWTISTFVASFLSMICWSIGLSRLPISVAYPFIGVTFVLVLLGSTLFFQEIIQVKQVVGIVLIIIGIIFVGQR